MRFFQFFLGGLLLLSVFSSARAADEAYRENIQRCEAGSDEDCFMLGVAYRRNDRAVEAVAPFARLCDRLILLRPLERPVCQEGSEEGARICLLGTACGALGMLYGEGEGIEREVNKAAIYHQKACDSGKADSCLEAGMLYQSEESLESIGKNSNETTALLLFDRACALGHPVGCLQGGKAREAGQGIEKNVGQALAHYRQACLMGRYCDEYMTLASSAPEDPKGPRARQVIDMETPGGFCDSGEKTFVLSYRTQVREPYRLYRNDTLVLEGKTDQDGRLSYPLEAGNRYRIEFDFDIAYVFDCSARNEAVQEVGQETEQEAGQETARETGQETAREAEIP